MVQIHKGGNDEYLQTTTCKATLRIHVSDHYSADTEENWVDRKMQQIATQDYPEATALLCISDIGNQLVFLVLG